VSGTKRPTKSQLAALKRIRDFVTFREQFPCGCDSYMCKRMIDAGWIVYDNEYCLTDAGRALVGSRLHPREGNGGEFK
jgi:hypothetical protein